MQGHTYTYIRTWIQLLMREEEKNYLPFQEPSQLYFYEVNSGQIKSKGIYEGSNVVKLSFKVSRWVIDIM